MATQPRHLHRLLAFLDPLLCLAALVVEVDDLPICQLRVGDDEAQPGEELSGMMLNLGNHATRRRPTCGPIEKALVPNHRLVCRTPYRTDEQFGNVPQQAIV